jgi:redox-sensitive bicupin YhaK (pirin superfamily)
LRLCRSGWLQVIDGELEVNGNRLTKGDAAGIQKTGELMLSATKPAHFLFFDLN